jgi:hypothetical protein
MFARGCSTRCQMKSPSIAQRGEGGARGGSGEFGPAVLCMAGCGSLPKPVGRGLPGGNSLSFASPKESKQRKGDAMVWAPPLRCGQPAVLAKNGVELALSRLRQSLALIHFSLRSSAQPDGWRAKTNAGKTPESLKRKALQGRESQQTVMCARESSARGQMGLPSLAQRGEGRAGGWEWGVQSCCLRQKRVRRLAGSAGVALAVGTLIRPSCCEGKPRWPPQWPPVFPSETSGCRRAS